MKCCITIISMIKKEVKEVLDWIKTQFYSAVNEVKSIPELMAFEGDLWLRFYSTFKYFFT